MLTLNYKNRLLDTFGSFFNEGDKHAYPTLKLYSIVEGEDVLVATLVMKSPAFAPARENRLDAYPISSANALCAGTILKFSLCNKDDYPLYIGYAGTKDQLIQIGDEEPIKPQLILNTVNVQIETFLEVKSLCFYYAG